MKTVNNYSKKCSLAAAILEKSKFVKDLNSFYYFLAKTDVTFNSEFYSARRKVWNDGLRGRRRGENREVGSLYGIVKLTHGWQHS